MGEQPQIEYKAIEAKLVGSNVVCYRLEDDTLIKVYVDVQRIGIAINQKAPDGTPIYNITANIYKIMFEPKNKIFKAPAPPIPLKTYTDRGAQERYMR